MADYKFKILPGLPAGGTEHVYFGWDATFAQYLLCWSPFDQCFIAIGFTQGGVPNQSKTKGDDASLIKCWAHCPNKVEPVP